MLLIISEKESYCKESIEQILNSSLADKNEDVYILVSSPSFTITVSSLIDQLNNIYDSFNRYKSESKLNTQITVILHDEVYDPSVASKLWSEIIHTSSVDLSKIPNPYKSHVSNDKISTILVKNPSTASEVHKNYRLANQKAKYNSVPISAVGGTFDHLHDGHKILLIVSAFLTSKRLIVGVTGPELLKNKKYAQFLESYDLRVSNVLALLNAIKPSLSTDIYEINDVCGPTAKIQDINALVVSLESSKGADYVNNVRSNLGWNPLDVYTIGVLGSADSDDFQNKMSSTDYRKAEYIKQHM